MFANFGWLPEIVHSIEAEHWRSQVAHKSAAGSVCMCMYVPTPTHALSAPHFLEELFAFTCIALHSYMYVCMCELVR